MIEQFKKSLNIFSAAVQSAIANDINLSDDSKVAFNDFKGKQREYFRNSVIGSRVALARDVKSILPLADINADNRAIVSQISGFVDELNSSNDLSFLQTKVNGIASLFTRLKVPKKEQLFKKLSSFPSAIEEELCADLVELENCFQNSCLRSAVILCGRILEVALHRKYYEQTGNDILETNPGIGLGSLIAKLKDKGIEFDPGLANQIHLINQIRIHCVHKKTSILQPSKTQTKAIILYTVDVLEKLFRSKPGAEAKLHVANSNI